MSRIRIVLGAVAVAAAAAGVAIPAAAGADGDEAWTKPDQQRVEQAPTQEAQPKWPGDPYVGKCVYWLKGDNQLRECKR